MSVVAQTVSFCTFRSGKETLGIATSAVLEVLRRSKVRAVPLAPNFVAGVLPYRGDVLTAVSLRALLGEPQRDGEDCALVLHDETSGETFALLVDALTDVVEVDAAGWQPNPATLDARHAAIFCGAYQRKQGLLAALDVERLQPR